MDKLGFQNIFTVYYVLKNNTTELALKSKSFKTCKHFTKRTNKKTYTPHKIIVYRQQQLFLTAYY